MPSQSQKKSGYQYSQPIDDGSRVCFKMEIPDTPQYRNAVVGQLSELAKWWNWKKTYIPGDRDAALVAELFSQLFFTTFEFLDCDGCEDMLRFRQNPTNSCQFQASYNGGATWETIFDYSLCTPQPSTSELGNTVDEIEQRFEELQEQYNGTPQSIYPESTWGGSGSDTIRNEALCFAATLFVDQICEVGIEYNNQRETLQDSVLNFAALALTVAAAIVTFFVGVGTFGAGAALAFAILSAVIASTALLDSVTDDTYKNEDAKAKVVCCLYDAIKDQTPTAAVWAAGLDNCEFDEGSDEYKIAEIGQIALADNRTYLEILDFMANAYTTSDNGGEVPGDCSCPNDIIIVPFDDDTWTTVERIGGNRWRVTGGCNTGASPDRYELSFKREGGGCFTIINWFQNFPNSAAVNPRYGPCAGGTALYPIPDNTCVSTSEMLYSIGCGISGQRYVEFETVDDCP